MTNEATYVSELNIALGEYMDSPAIWYENTAPFNLLKQRAYVGQDRTYYLTVKDPISFVDVNGKLAMLDEMLPETKEGQDGEAVPFTDDATVGQKMHIRVLIPNKENADVLDCEVSKLINVWGFQNEPQLITKSRLGSRIAKVLKESGEFMAFCKREDYAFENLALRHLKNVSKGSWQPELYIKAH